MSLLHCWANHVFHTEPGASANSNRTKDFPSWRKRKKPKGIVIVVCLLIKWHSSVNSLFSLCSWFCFFILSLTFLKHCHCSYSFCTTCLCLWWKRVFAFRNKRKEGRAERAHESRVGSPMSEWQSASEKVFAKENCFPGLDCQWSSETMWLPFEKTALIISLVLSLSFQFRASLSQSPCTCYLIEHLRFPATIYLTNQVCWVKYSVKLYQTGRTTHS